MNASEAGCFAHEAKGSEERIRSLARSKVKADDRTEGPHLARCDRMARMVWQTRIVDTANAGVGAKKIRDLQCGCALTSQAQRQRRQGSVCQPRFHRAWDRAVLCTPRAHCPGSLLISCCDVAEHEIAVAREGFGVGSDHIVGAECQRLLEIRSCSRVIDDDQHAVSPSGLDQTPNVADVEVRVARRLDPQQPSPFEYFCLSIASCRC